MSFKDLFTHKSDAEIRHWIYIKKPETIGSLKDIEYYSGRAAQGIAEAESIIATLKEYQQALCTRYQEIAATNYKLLLSLERHISRYDNTKDYTVTIVKRFEGNNVKDETILKENYAGKERHKAIKRFEALKKEYPNIETEIDIEKKFWEK